MEATRPGSESSVLDLPNTPSVLRCTFDAVVAAVLLIICSPSLAEARCCSNDPIAVPVGVRCRFEAAALSLALREAAATSSLERVGMEEGGTVEGTPMEPGSCSDS